MALASHAADLGLILCISYCFLSTDRSDFLIVEPGATPEQCWALLKTNKNRKIGMGSSLGHWWEEKNTLVGGYIVGTMYV